MRELGDDYETIHKTWLHRIANLTLNGYNSKYSNSPFAEKRDMEHGFARSGLRMNQWIGQRKQWGLNELEQRDKYLRELALKVWPIPESDFKPEKKQLECCTLDDKDEINGRKITRFAYKNSIQPVKNWTEMFEQVLRILHTDDKSVLLRLAYATDSNDPLTTYVSMSPKFLRSALKIDKDVFVEINTSTSKKITMLQSFFKAFNINPKELTFYLKAPTDDENAMSGAEREELRRRYWTTALPVIRLAHSDQSQCFSAISPSRDSWINGSFGVGGFSIACVGNYDFVRVEICLSSGDRKRNKEAFDYLLAHKDEIESKVGVSLNWDRRDNRKVSCVRHTLEGLGIKNESNWARAARFHAEWSRKFYDAFVPLLREKYVETD